MYYLLEHSTRGLNTYTPTHGRGADSGKNHRFLGRYLLTEWDSQAIGDHWVPSGTSVSKKTTELHRKLSFLCAIPQAPLVWNPKGCTGRGSISSFLTYKARERPPLSFATVDCLLQTTLHTAVTILQYEGNITSFPRKATQSARSEHGTGLRKKGRKEKEKTDSCHKGLHKLIRTNPLLCPSFFHPLILSHSQKCISSLVWDPCRRAYAQSLIRAISWFFFFFFFHLKKISTHKTDTVTLDCKWQFEKPLKCPILHYVKEQSQTALL